IGSGAGRSNRGQTQLVTVSAISGSGPYSVSISPGLYMPNWRSSQAPGAWWSNSLPITGVGIEDLSIDVSGVSGGTTNVIFYTASNCWIKGIRSIKANGQHVWLYQTAHTTVRDSYFFQTYNSAS